MPVDNAIVKLRASSARLIRILHENQLIPAIRVHGDKRVATNGVSPAISD
jgi:predicted transcriptional regulator